MMFKSFIRSSEEKRISIHYGNTVYWLTVAALTLAAIVLILTASPIMGMYEYYKCVTTGLLAGYSLKELNSVCKAPYVVNTMFMMPFVLICLTPLVGLLVTLYLWLKAKDYKLAIITINAIILILIVALFTIGVLRA